MVSFGNDWDYILKDEFSKEYYLKLREFLKEEYKEHVIFPDMYSIFNAFKCTSYKDTRAVILGQDPYHEFGQAHGMAFSVMPGVEKPPSLKNIFKELNSDLGIPIPEDGCLIPWAKNGALLLNTVLTVREHLANSHKGKGWETFTDNVIKALNDKDAPVVFILWGKNAESKKELITNPKHLVLTGAHPSPLSASRGFFGGHYFSKTNEFLKKNNEGVIDWRL